MKHIYFLLFISLSVLVQAQNVGIGTMAPDTSAIIEMKSTNKGILIPRITEAARLQIVDPAHGLLVFQTNSSNANSLQGFYYFDGSYDSWYRIGASNQIGIGTENPHPKAILEMKSTSQGVLFPTLTSVQRNAITNPPNGLHIFNSDERCLNYYDATNQVWNCYCAECKTVVINITTNQQNLDFYDLVQNNPSAKYVVNISPGVTISASTAGGDAFIFTTMTFPAAITIVNNGTIAGAGGVGGKAVINGNTAGTCPGTIFPSNGGSGGDAILTKTGVTISIKNYGIIAGGGGGGKPGSNVGETGYGGGGGGGAGIINGLGGHGGGNAWANQFGSCNTSYVGIGGLNGTATSGGDGGAGVGGGTDGTAGGARGSDGVGIVGGIFGGGAGAGGKAIRGGSGNSITNFGSGQYFGLVD
jgi:hypothetical protein